MSKSVDKVNDICHDIRNLKDKDFKAVGDMAKKQSSYAHPLKAKTAGKYQDIGNKNLKIIEKLKELKSVIEE